MIVVVSALILSGCNSCKEGKISKYLGTSGSDGMFSYSINTYETENGKIVQDSRTLSVGDTVCEGYYPRSK